MVDIYKYASPVIAWLGPPTPESAHAFSTLGHLGSQVELNQSGMNFICSPSFHAAVSLPSIELSYNKFTWMSIDALCRLPWFYRLWIVQEIQMANSRALLQSGNDQISWYLFRRAISYLAIKEKEMLPGLMSRVSLLILLTDNLHATPFASLVRLDTTRRCSEPADVIYGIFGLASPAMISKIQPDYTLPTSQVYMRTFLEFTRHTQRLELLIYGDETIRLPESPSWVPDFHGSKGRSWNVVEHASGHSSAIWNFVEPNILQVSGIKVSKIRGICGVMQHPNDLFSFFSGATHEMLAITYPPTGETMLDTYAHVLTTGSTHERYNNWLNLPRLGQVSSLVLDITAGKLHQNRLTEDLFEHVKGSMFAYTESGHFGLVPPSTRCGDYLCILLGFTHPICLRSTANGGHYEVVGGCSYIHGLMDAEALLGPQVGGWSFERQFNTRGISTAGYLNTATQDWVPADYDPRLGPRPDDWEVVPTSSWSQHDAMKYEEWRNKTTGEVISSDPRLTPEALKERGVHLETFSII